MPPKSKVPIKNKYAETVKSKVKNIIQDDESEDELEIENPKPQEPDQKQEQPEQEQEQPEEVKPEPEKTAQVKQKRKYVKKPKDLYAGPVATAQYNSVLERMNGLAELFVKLQEDQVRLNEIVKKTVKETSAEQHKKLDNTLQESREFFARLAR